MPRTRTATTLLLALVTALSVPGCGPTPAELEREAALAARDALLACLAHDVAPDTRWPETAPEPDVPRVDRLGLLGGEIGEVLVGGGLHDVSYWPLSGDTCSRMSDASLPFAVLAHDRLDATSGFLTGVTADGLGVVAEYRLCSEGFELRRLAQAACLGRLTGLTHDPVGRRLLLWDAHAGRLDELRFDADRASGTLRRLLDPGTAPQLAGFRASWWIDSSAGGALRLSTEPYSDTPTRSPHALLHMPARDGVRACRVQVADDFHADRAELVPLPAPRVRDALPLPPFEAWHVR